MPGLDEDIAGWLDWINGDEPDEKLSNESCLRCECKRVIEKDDEGIISYWCQECSFGWWHEWQDSVTVYQLGNKLWCVEDRMWDGSCLVVMVEREEE